jgi:hypothetical protein
MTDGGATFRPGDGGLPFQPRSAYVGHEVFGHGDGAVLVEPEVARDLRSAAEFASLERRIAGGLLYGRALADDEGRYLVVDGFLEAGPGEGRGDRASRDGFDSFALSDADLRLLREDAARMYPAAIEAGWWRTLAGPGEFGPTDFETQGQLVGPGGVGLLVFGAGLDWATAYLGPGGQVPGSARSFMPVPRPAAEAQPVPIRELGPVPGTVREPAAVARPEAAPGPEAAPELEAEPEARPGPGPLPEPEPEAEAEAEAEALPEPEAEVRQEAEPEPVAVAAAGTSLATRRQSQLTPPPQPAGPRVISPVRVTTRELGTRPVNPGYVGPRTPTDVKIVVVALVIAIVVAAVIIGVLSSSVLIAVIVAVVALVLTLGVILFSRI